MDIRTRFSWAPIAAFALAVGLTLLGGPSTRALSLASVTHGKSFILSLCTLENCRIHHRNTLRVKSLRRGL